MWLPSRLLSYTLNFLSCSGLGLPCIFICFFFFLASRVFDWLGHAVTVLASCWHGLNAHQRSRRTCCHCRSATVAGGTSNTATADYAFIGGGQSNLCSGSWCAVGGGFTHSATGDYATVGGGDSNVVTGAHSTVAGGDSSIVSGSWSAVGGGNANVVSGFYATVAGGRQNSGTAIYAVVGGGWLNRASVGVYVARDSMLNSCVSLALAFDH